MMVVGNTAPEWMMVLLVLLLLLRFGDILQFRELEQISFCGWGEDEFPVVANIMRPD